MATEDKTVWRVGTRLLAEASGPLLWGVVNVTPDSFSDGGRSFDAETAVRHGPQLAEDGAAVLDLGGESSRPGAQPVPVEEELRRVLPVLRGLRARLALPLSIDTAKAAVARAALDAGADIVNDISGLRFDPGMLPLLAGSSCGVVLMHMLGEPRTMQIAPHYDDVVREVRDWLAQRLEEVVAAGIAPERLVLDPGLGFGKRYADNIELLRNLRSLRARGRPLLVGASRKAFLGWLLAEPEPRSRLEGDLAVHAWCRYEGVAFLRVHDVRATRRLFRVLDALEGRDGSLDRQAHGGGNSPQPAE